MKVLSLFSSSAGMGKASRFEGFEGLGLLDKCFYVVGFVICLHSIQTTIFLELRDPHLCGIRMNQRYNSRVWKIMVRGPKSFRRLSDSDLDVECFSTSTLLEDEEFRTISLCRSRCLEELRIRKLKDLQDDLGATISFRKPRGLQDY